VQHTYEVLRGHCWDEPFINISATCLLRKYPDTSNRTGKTHWSCMFQFPKYVHTVTSLQLVHLDYTCISHYGVCGIWLSMNYYSDNCWSVNSWWICTIEDFLFYWTVTSCMYCVLLKNMQLTCTALVESHQTWDNFWEKTYRCAVQKHESVLLHDVLFWQILVTFC